MQGRPDESSGLGRLVAAIGEQHFEIWHENVAALEVFSSMLTQWSVGASGAIGLRYESLPMVMGLMGVPASRHREVFESVRLMEKTVLEHFRGE